MFNFLALLDIRVFGRLYNHCGFCHFVEAQAIHPPYVIHW